MDDLDWPARAYVYGTFLYALKETLIRVKKHSRKMFLYRGELDGESVWVSSWDPKPVENDEDRPKSIANDGHRPKPDGSCSLFCICKTPLTNNEMKMLDSLGLF